MTDTCCTIEIVAGSQDIPEIELSLDATILDLDIAASDPIELSSEVLPIEMPVESSPIDLAFVIQGEQGIQGEKGDKGDAGASGGGVLFTEEPDGLVDGVNRDFFLTHTPVPNSLLLFVNGLLQINYTLINNLVRFHPDDIPSGSDGVFARYQYQE